MIIRIVIALLLGSWSLQAQEFRIEVSTDRILIGEQFNVDLYVKAPAGARVEWPAVPSDSSMHWQLVNRERTDTSADGGNALYLQRWVGTSFDSGFAVIPPITIRIDGAEYASEPQLIQIDLPEVGEAYRDITDPGSSSHWTWLWWLLPNLVIAVLVFILLYRRRNKIQSAAIEALDHRSIPEQVRGNIQRIRQSNQPLETQYSQAIKQLERLTQCTVGASFASLPKAEKIKVLNARQAGSGIQWSHLMEAAEAWRFGGLTPDGGHEAWMTQAEAWSAQWMEQSENSRYGMDE